MIVGLSFKAHSKTLVEYMDGRPVVNIFCDIYFSILVKPDGTFGS